MKLDEDNDCFVLPNGRRFSRCGIVCIDPDGKLFFTQVSHSGLELIDDLTDDCGKRILLSLLEKKELADMMIARWKSWTE